MDRRNFERAVQREGETFDGFMTRLKGLAEDADLCRVCLDSRLTDRVIDGVRSQASHLELLRQRAFPTLKDAISLCRSYEVADWDANRGRGRDRGGAVQVVRRTAYKQRQWDEKAARASSRPRGPSRGPVRQSRGTSRGPKGRSRDRRCGQCGREGHLARGDCPARDSTCHTCGKKGHWVPCCHQKPRERQDRQRSTSRGRSGRGTANHVGVVGASVGTSEGEFEPLDVHGFCPLRYVHARVAVTLPGGKLLQLGQHAVLPDTGASASLISAELYKVLRENAGSQPAPRLRPLEASLKAANGGDILAYGVADFVIEFEGRSADVPFVVTPSFKGGILINCYLSEELGMVVFPAKRPWCRATPDNASTSYVSCPCETLEGPLHARLSNGALRRESPFGRGRNRVEARPRARPRSESRRRSATCIGMRGGPDDGRCQRPAPAPAPAPGTAPERLETFLGPRSEAKRGPHDVPGPSWNVWCDPPDHWVSRRDGGK